MSQTTDDLIRDYLEDLDAELEGLPRAARREVVAEISAHIDELRSEQEGVNEAETRRMLERVGDPVVIAADARERFGIPPRRRTWVEVTALVLLAIGGVVPLLGWLVGVILLWTSEVWNTREKLLGTLFAPAAWFVVAWFALQTVGGQSVCLDTTDERGRTISASCSGGTSDFNRIFWPTLLIAGVVASVATIIFLGLRLRRSSRSAVLA